ncbi:NAD(P)-dependent oxidoreductase [Thalassotalea sp. 1_MG-2023]|uniref:siroheme synthase n=1 Tax=Thalassotalea sp. 1_MG-2023 TaxID=3062680 RepID=UPI0026E3AFBE|nr:NAD(P)-dependent oxidoreductase [Thalassotalea sp. 1_MG-2023]MDO6426139.1 NAD(P)-dependent oxidoreductase [Thalassotalea sp. 1_MG-2023]
MNYFPIFLTANRINALIVGGGDVAARKIELLLKANCTITVMSEKCNETVERLIDNESLEHLPHQYQANNLQQFNLIIAATDDEAVNQQVAANAHQLDILVNVVDQPALCSWITPSIIDRDPMLIALSSSGSAPILLRMLREQIEKTLPDGYGKLANFSYKFRDHVKARIKGVRNRRAFWEEILRGSIGQLVLDGNIEQAELQLIQQLKQEVSLPSGEIVFIHTLLGNPDNLTLSAHREMQFADAVIYDEQVNPAFIEYIRRDADKYPQQINADVLINAQHALELAEAGKKVIYLLAGHQTIPHNSALSLSQVTVKELVCGT